MNEPTNTEDLSTTVTANYLLTDVTVRTFGGQRTDRAVTAEIHQQKGASSSTGKYVRNLFGDKCKELKAVCSAYNSLRNFMYDNTLSWVSDNSGAATGSRLLPVANSIQFLGDWNAKKNAAIKLRDAMADDLPAIIAHVRLSMGSMAPDVSEYPTADEFRSKFDATLAVDPVPAVTDFSRLSVPGQMAEGLATIYEGRMAKKMVNAKAESVTRTIKYLTVYATQVGKEAAGNSTRMYQTMLDKLRREAGLLGAIGAADPESPLESIAMGIIDELLTPIKNIAQLKGNQSLCRELTRAANKHIKALGGTDVADAIPEVAPDPDPVSEKDELDAKLEAALADMGVSLPDSEDDATPMEQTETPADSEDVTPEYVSEGDEYVNTEAEDNKPTFDVSTEAVDPDDFLL